MTYHEWGNDWPHWNELYEAESFIIDYVYKWSRCRLSCKEKYGTIRYEYVYPPGSRAWWLSIKIPFFRRKIMDGKFEVPYYLFRWPTSWLYYKWMRFGDYILGQAVRKACIKFPNVVEEITGDLNWR